MITLDVKVFVAKTIIVEGLVLEVLKIDRNDMHKEINLIE